MAVCMPASDTDFLATRHCGRSAQIGERITSNALLGAATGALIAGILPLPERISFLWPPESATPINFLINFYVPFFVSHLITPLNTYLEKKECLSFAEGSSIKVGAFFFLKNLFSVVSPALTSASLANIGQLFLNIKESPIIQTGIGLGIVSIKTFTPSKIGAVELAAFAIIASGFGVQRSAIAGALAGAAISTIELCYQYYKEAAFQKKLRKMAISYAETNDWAQAANCCLASGPYKREAFSECAKIFAEKKQPHHIVSHFAIRIEPFKAKSSLRDQTYYECAKKFFAHNNYQAAYEMSSEITDPILQQKAYSETSRLGL